MRFGFVLMTLAMAAVTPRFADAAAVCPDRTPIQINSVPEGSLKCQTQIAKSGAKYLKTKLKTLAKCKMKSPAGTCPSAIDTGKMELAATKEAGKIATACGPDAAQAGLTSSTYASSTDDVRISSCVLGQHSVVAELISAESHGPTTEVWPGTSTARANCMKQVSKLGVTMIDKSLKASTKCILGQMKLGTAGNLAPICVGSWSGGVFTPPTDPKAQLAYAKVVAKVENVLGTKCELAEVTGEIDTMFACAGATTIEDLQNCLVCGGYRGMVDAVEQEFSESGTYVSNGAGALQTAVDAAAVGEKLLIASGDYQEEVQVETNDLQIVGCGAATNDRPRVIPPGTEVSGRGFFAFDVDGLVFQSLDFFNQNEDHIFVGGANGVTFRDITGDGNRNTRYAVFPVQSDGVLVEICKVRRQNDAPIYVGQSINIVVRYNDVRAGVAGIEIENSGNAQVYGNYAGRPFTTLPEPDETDGGNTGGMLVFQDPQLIPLSDCHDIHHNLMENNNEDNFGTGTVSGVPRGTGILVISNRHSLFRRNIARGNETFGIALTDHHIAGFNGAPRDPHLLNDVVFANILLGNGSDPDPAGQGAGGDFASLTFYAPTGTCFQTTGPLANTFVEADDIVPALPQCATLPPPPFGQCPVGFPTTTTTTTSSTTTTTL